MVSFCLPEMIFQDVSFERDHHTAILIALRALDGDYLMKTKCYFGGGTAIVLELGEYRKSIALISSAQIEMAIEPCERPLQGSPT